MDELITLSPIRIIVRISEPDKDFVCKLKDMNRPMFHFFSLVTSVSSGFGRFIIIILASVTRVHSAIEIALPSVCL